jgi:outer membrane protein assembly factor BamA
MRKLTLKAAVLDTSWRAVVLLMALAAANAWSDDAAGATQDEPIPDGATLERMGVVIGEIDIYPESIFDLEDPKEDKALYRLANKLHINTKPDVIRQQLLFKSGDLYSQRLVDESERILRDARYLYDARIRPVALHDGRVDLAVVTRDVWTLNPGISFGRKGGKNTSGIELEELNLLGTGTALSISRKSGIDRDSTLLEYKDRNLFDSWWRVDAQYASNSDGRVRALDVDRPFYALDSRWAAGMSLLDDAHIEPLYDLGHVVDEFQSQRKLASVSWGWSLGLKNGWAHRWTVGATYDSQQFNPVPSADLYSLVPEDRKFVYPWIGYELVQDEFGKYTNHDQIGRTEDFFLGTRLSMQLGYASQSFGSDRDAVIFAAKASHGAASVDQDSTLLLTGTLKGRAEGGALRNTVMNASARYYLQQSQRRLFFATIEGAAGRALDLDTQILLGGDNGLRGYPLRYQGGDARALLTLEERYFTDWYPFRLFRVGAAAFVDVGRTWGQGEVNTPSQGWLKDIGFGLRLGSTRSGLGNVIHVDLAFPLDGGSDIKNVQLLIETKEQF